MQISGWLAQKLIWFDAVIVTRNQCFQSQALLANIRRTSFPTCSLQNQIFHASKSGNESTTSVQMGDFFPIHKHELSLAQNIMLFQCTKQSQNPALCGRNLGWSKMQHQITKQFNGQAKPSPQSLPCFLATGTIQTLYYSLMIDFMSQ